MKELLALLFDCFQIYIYYLFRLERSVHLEKGLAVEFSELYIKVDVHLLFQCLLDELLF